MESETRLGISPHHEDVAFCALLSPTFSVIPWITPTSLSSACGNPSLAEGPAEMLHSPFSPFGDGLSLLWAASYSFMHSRQIGPVSTHLVW